MLKKKETVGKDESASAREQRRRFERGKDEEEEEEENLRHLWEGSGSTPAHPENKMNN